jgi:NTP pyrophosphatase (non-canonical NTP hydrolase)
MEPVMNADEYQKLADVTNLPSYSGVMARMSRAKFARLMHGAMGLTTEAGEFMDALKKHAMYGKALDEVNLKEELGDMLWYVALVANTLGVEMATIMATNIAKLRTRYPEKFTEAAALTRDLEAERKVLESPELLCIYCRKKVGETNSFTCGSAECMARNLPESKG